MLRLRPILSTLIVFLALSQAARPAEPVLVADARAEGVSLHERYMFICLQGLANRDAPRVYLKLQRSDSTWLAWYREHYGIEMRTLESPYELFAAGDWPIAGYCLVDPQAPHTFNIAAGYCAIENLLPVTAKILEDPRMPDLEVKRDLRGKFRAMGPVEVYSWVYEHQFPEAAKDVIGSLDVGRDVHKIFAFHHIRDYVIARGGIFIGLSSEKSDHPQEHRLKSKFLEGLDKYAFVMGWHMDRDREPDHVRQVTRHGGLVFCSTESSNFSFHRFIENRGPFRQPPPPEPSEVTVEPKIYVSFIYSDGDSLNHFSRGHSYQYFHERRGEVPVGWEIQPMLLELAPGMLEYFYEKASPNDSFIASASAIGYENPEYLKPEKLRELLEASVPYFEKVDVSSLMLLYDPQGANVSIDPALREIYDQELGQTIDSVFEGYWKTKGESSVEDDLVWLVTELPVLMVNGSETKQIINQLHKLARETDERPQFVPIHVPKGHMDYQGLLKIQEALDSRFQIVLPEVLAATYRAHATR